MAIEKFEYEDPDGSTWIIGVDAWSAVFIIKPPNIDPFFLKYKNAEEIGLPYLVEGWQPGVYRVKCNIKTTIEETKWGVEENWGGFTIVESDQLTIGE
jgi:hypothetical protein